MKLAILINARLGSKRLPKKHLRDVAGKMAIERVIDRVNIGLPIIIATGDELENRDLRPIALKNKVEIFFGDPFNIPNRHLQISKKYGLEGIVSIDADDLLVSKTALQCVIEDIVERDMPLARTCGLPLGMNVLWAYTVQNLIQAIQNIPKGEKRSTDTGWGWLFDKMLLSTAQMQMQNAHRIRATLDYPEDLKFFRAVYRLCPKAIMDDDKKLCEYLINHRINHINKKYFSETACIS